MLGLAFGAFPLYHHLTGLSEAYAPHSLATEWDRALPFVPGWAYVYHFVAFASLLPVFVVKDRQLFRRVGLAACVVEFTTFVMFFVFPVKMERPELSATTWLLRLGHAVLVLVRLGLWFFPVVAREPGHARRPVLLDGRCLGRLRHRGDRARDRGLTLLVKQHFVLDVLFGAALGALGWRPIVAPARAHCRAPSDALRYPRSRVLVVFAIYAVVLGAMHLAYRARWEPWSGSDRAQRAARGGSHG